MIRVAVTGVSAGSLPAPGDGFVRRQPEEAVENDPHATAKGWRRMSWSSKLAYLACARALEEANRFYPATSDTETALVVGSRYGSLSLFEEFHRVLLDEGPRAVSPTVFTTGVLNAPVGHTSLGQGLRGPCHALVGSDACGLEALALAWELIATGAARRAVAVGVEEAPQILVEALRAATALPAGREVGEGAAAVVLEALPDGGIATVDAVATARCGRAHDSVAAHAALLQAVRGSEPIAEVWLPGHPGADGRREVAACAQALGADVPVEAWSADTGYAPGWTSLATVAQGAVAAATGKRVIATAYGGSGTTVAVRLSPPS